MQRKPLIVVVIAVLVVILIYGSFPRSDLFAVTRGQIECTGGTGTDPSGPQSIFGPSGFYVECCQTETGDDGVEIRYCTQCSNTNPPSNCGPRYQSSIGLEETPPPAGPSVLPEDGVLEQPPRPPPFDPTAPLQGGVLEQPPTSQPLGPFAPLQGGVLEQPPSEGGVTQRGCQSNVITTCLPCDLGLPGASCIPASEWPPDIAQQEQGEGAAPPFVPGFLERQQVQPPPADQGAAELPPPPATTEGTQPATEQSVPVCQEGLEFNEDLGFCVPEDCPEGQVLDEQSGICVLEEPETEAAEEPEQSEPEEEQPSEESDSGNGSND